MKARLKRELAEMLLIPPPRDIADVGITVMDGPFFSTMPFPAAKLHSLSHVRYTPHEAWTEPGHGNALPTRSNAAAMLRDAARFLPVLAKVEPVRSIFEIKTVLLRNEDDDGRPILAETCVGEPAHPQRHGVEDRQHLRCAGDAARPPVEGERMRRERLTSVSLILVVKDTLPDRALLDRLLAVLGENFTDVETILVADGSGAGVRDLKSLVATLPDATCLVLAEWLDTEVASMVGMENAVCDHVLLLSLTEAAVAAVPEAIERIRAGYDAVFDRAVAVHDTFIHRAAY